MLISNQIQKDKGGDFNVDDKEEDDNSRDDKNSEDIYYKF